MNGFFDENGEMLLPGFEGEWAFQPRQGFFNPNSKIQQSSQCDEWYTDPIIVDLATELYEGKIDLDPMSSDVANTVVKAEKYYTAEIDGLTRPWFGNMLWNPPWGGGVNSPKARGVKKLVEAYSSGDVKACVCVFNVGVLTTNWFAPIAGSPMCIPPKRMRHWAPDGGGTSPNSGTIVVYVGHNQDDFGKIFQRLGRIMIPWNEND